MTNVKGGRIMKGRMRLFFEGQEVGEERYELGDVLPLPPLTVTGTLAPGDGERLRQWAEELERWPSSYIPAGDIIEGGPVWG